MVMVVPLLLVTTVNIAIAASIAAAIAAPIKEKPEQPSQQSFLGVHSLICNQEPSSHTDIVLATICSVYA